LSVLGTSSKEAGKIANLVKEENPNVYVVWGNYHPSFNAERILRKYPDVDIIVRGEGEDACLELAACIEKGEDFRKVAGVTYRGRDGEIVATPERPLLTDVDSLPFPDRGLTDCDYASRVLGVTTVTKKFTSLLSSRGCPFQCTFCACQNFARGIWRPRSVENIVDELEFLQATESFSL
jgi:anaerobic magnesium-protoporphyrin IX monomethyl ester cyclase